MSTKRKTLPVSNLVQRVNHMIAMTPDEMRESRVALAVLVESVLMDTNNYKGFGYVGQQNEDGSLIDGYDDSRRRYFGGGS